MENRCFPAERPGPAVRVQAVPFQCRIRGFPPPLVPDAQASRADAAVTLVSALPGPVSGTRASCHAVPFHRMMSTPELTLPTAHATRGDTAATADRTGSVSLGVTLPADARSEPCPPAPDAQPASSTTMAAKAASDLIP